jgi:hypothetical protein
MSEVRRSSICADCGGAVDELPGAAMEDRSPCPLCGSLYRRVDLQLAGKIEVRSSLSVKAKTPGEKKPFVEQRVGSSLFRKSGRWSFIDQLIDRRNNRYRKKIVDEESGVVLRDDDGKLTDHQGFGSAKRRE